MSKFIETNKLLAEIELDLSAHDKVDHLEAQEVGKAWNRGHKQALENIRDFIHSLQQEQPEADLEKLVNEEFASRSRATERGLEVAYNRAELSRFIKRIALVFTTKKEVQQEQPSLPSNLDEAAEKFAHFYDNGTCDGVAQECFKAGAEWMAEQLKNMKAKKGGIK